MKYIARVNQILETGIHRLARIENGEITSYESMPLPERVEIEIFADGDECMMYRYTRSGEFCGDTWHAELTSAFSQAKFEYGLRPEDFLVVHDGTQEPQQ